MAIIHHHHHTMTTTTDQAEPPELILAVLNEKKTFIENLTIAGTKVDMYLIEDVLSGLYAPNNKNLSESGNPFYENALLMEFGTCALSDMSQYFILHSIYLALSTYTRKSLIGSCFKKHIKKETGMDISLRKINSITQVSYPEKRKLVKCLGILAHIHSDQFNVFGDNCQPNDAVKFRIWIRSELNAIAEDIKLIEPSLKVLPEVVRLRIKEREEHLTRKEEFECSMKERIPYIGISAGQI